ncbi:hypothetical protein ACJ73_06181 [Blastomyces percursus]|uniref:Ketoreductase (KR) domain-containing protein n=1 Tax=Blastomyces percursus TaxID=1658174 RepID=A0A1J9R1W4_9EURO|nr:hypothetical protein ACJ73_06181 [Blastomyces percursus]
MVSLITVRASNQRLKTAIPGITALFVGGTTGIGQSTLRQLAIHSEKPNVYIIGRNKEKASPFLAELGKLNPGGSFQFIEADVSLIRNVDRACEMIKNKEDRLNMLFMTPGGISLSGRRETTEGIDQIFALRYYSRMRFIQNLLPLLSTATPARVVSIFGGGFESSINTSDLDLKHNFSILNCAKHAITMTSLSMEHLASTTASQQQQQPTNDGHLAVSFMHIYPSLVRSNIYTNSFPAPIAAFYNYVLWPTMMWPFSVDAQESGERHLFHLTSACYPGGNGDSSDTIASKQQNDGISVSVSGDPSAVEMAIGSNGKRGSGSYFLNWKGDGKPGSKFMQKYREEGMPEIVWRHTVNLLDEAASRNIIQ